MKQYFTDDEDKLQEFKDLLLKPQKIILTAHQNPDGDAFGSTLGLKAYLCQRGHDVTVISPNGHADYIAWMPGANEVLDYENKGLECDQLIQEASLIFCCDFSALNRLKTMEGAVRAAKAKKVLIDHHQEPEGFADFVFWNERAAATCELIYDLMERLGELKYINSEVATCLYTGILTDTGSFKFESTSKEIHRIAGELIDKGINTNKINRKLFDQNSLEKVKFLGFALAEKLNYLEEYHVAYFSFSEEELARFHSKKGDTEGLVNYGLSIAGAVMSVIFIERDGLIRISFRSVDDFSVSNFARLHFEGGGHKNAAGGKSTDSVENTVDKFLKLLPKYKNDLLAQIN